MRRKAGSTKKTKSRRGVPRKHKEVTTTQRSWEELLAAADQIMTTSMDVEQAAPLYSEAASLLRKESLTSSRGMELIQVLEKLGECKVSMGDPDGARNVFQEALTVLDEKFNRDQDPISYHERRYCLYFYVGQLCMEHEALQAYQSGITSLESCIAMAQEASTAEQDDEEDEKMDVETETISSKELVLELRQRLSGAFCTIAELYLTDLCFDDNAETECETYLEKALQLRDADGEPFLDALQTMASLRLSQVSRQTDAYSYILRAYEKMKVGCEALAVLVGLGEEKDEDMTAAQDKALELKEVDEANNLPEFEFRCQTAKLLLECASLPDQSSSLKQQQQQCVTAAISVLSSLLAQNDEVVEIWFLMGCAFAAKSPPMADSACYYLERAKEMLMDIKKSLEQQGQFADDEEHAEIQRELNENATQLDDVQAKLNDLNREGISPDMDDNHPGRDKQRFDDAIL